MAELTREQQVAFDEKLKDRALYRHTEVRLLARDGLKLSRLVWDRWHHLIRDQADLPRRIWRAISWAAVVKSIAANEIHQPSTAHR